MNRLLALRPLLAACVDKCEGALRESDVEMWEKVSLKLTRVAVAAQRRYIEAASVNDHTRLGVLRSIAGEAREDAKSLRERDRERDCSAIRCKARGESAWLALSDVAQLSRLSVISSSCLSQFTRECSPLLDRLTHSPTDQITKERAVMLDLRLPKTSLSL